MAERTGLRYVGGGFLPDVPARDLTDVEVDAFGGKKRLIASGLYAEPGETKKLPGASSNKAAEEAPQ